MVSLTLWKESSDNDDQQFHQNHKSTKIISHHNLLSDIDVWTIWRYQRVNAKSIIGGQSINWPKETKQNNEETSNFPNKLNRKLILDEDEYN